MFRHLSKAALTGVLIVGMAFSQAGCPTAQQWFQIAAGLIPIVLQTVSGLQTGNGGLSPAAEGAIQTFSATATTILNDISADINIVQTTPGVIPKIDAELAQLQKQAQALIPQFTNNPKVLAWVNAILADAIDLANLVPVIQAGGGTAHAQTTVVKMKVSLPKAQSYQDLFKQRLAVAQTF